MVVYLDVVMLLNSVIDGLLLIGGNRLCGYPSGWKRVIPAAVLGGVYSGVCLIGLHWFIASGFMRILVLILMGCIAYGIQLHAIRRIAMFALLSMSLGGIVSLIGEGGFLSLACSAILVILACLVGLRGGVGKRYLVPVEISYLGKNISFIALEDTGNELIDPLTGESILVVDSKIGYRLIGLMPEQLKNPTDVLTMMKVPGLRLISFRTIGQDRGLMLGMRFQEVRIGKYTSSRLIAFSPERMTDGYQGLVGGYLC